MMQEFVWRNFRFELPADWEMLRFSRRSEEGKCCFADRYRERAQLSWKANSAEPDLDETLRRFVEQQGSAKCHRSNYQQWRGVDTKEEGGRISRFLRYFAEAQCTLEILLTWPERKSDELRRQIVESISYEKPEGLQRWRAYGMELWVTEQSSLAGWQVSPALAKAEFECGTKNKIEFQRLGMVSEWLSSCPRDWLRLRLPPRWKQSGGF